MCLPNFREQQQDARENPIAAAAATAAVAGGAAPQNAENLLDIDFDGAAPASMMKQPPSGSSGLEGLAGTPQRVESPATGAPASSSNMDDLMGMFGNEPSAPAPQSTNDDLMNGFASLNMGNDAQPSSSQSGDQSGSAKKTNEDLLGLF